MHFSEKKKITVPCDIAKATPISNTNCCGKTLILEVLKIRGKIYIILLRSVDTKAIVVF